MRRLSLVIAAFVLACIPVYGQTSGLIDGSARGVASTLFRSCAAGETLVKDTSAVYGVSCGENDNEVITDFEGSFPPSGEWDPAASLGDGDPWEQSTTVAHSGTKSAKPGAVSIATGYSGMTYSFTAAGSGTLSFWSKVSSDPDKARLYLYDSSEQEYYDDECNVVETFDEAGITGEVDWTFTECEVEPGPHVYTFYYEKIDAAAVGSDSGWIDDVRLTITTYDGQFKGELVSTGAILTVADVGVGSCGNGSDALILGGPNSFSVTLFGDGTQCRVTFPEAAEHRRNCTASNETTAALVRAKYVDATHTDLLGTFASTHTIAVVCVAW